MRMSRSKLARTSVHDLCKRFHAARIITCETSRHIVWAFHQQRPEQIDSLIRVARLDIKFHRIGHGIDCLNSDRLIQKTALGDDQSRKQFLRAGSGAQKLLTALIIDRKSTRLNSSHRCISYAVFCLKKKKEP